MIEILKTAIGKIKSFFSRHPKTALVAIVVAGGMYVKQCSNSQCADTSAVGTGDQARTVPIGSIRRTIERARAIGSVAKAVSSGIQSLAGRDEVSGVSDIRSGGNNGRADTSNGDVAKPGVFQQSRVTGFLGGFTHNLGAFASAEGSFGADCQVYRALNERLGVNFGLDYYKHEEFRPIASVSWNIKNFTRGWTKNTEVFIGATDLSVDGLEFGLRINL